MNLNLILNGPIRVLLHMKLKLQFVTLSQKILRYTDLTMVLSG